MVGAGVCIPLVSMWDTWKLVRQVFDVAVLVSAVWDDGALVWRGLEVGVIVGTGKDGLFCRDKGGVTLAGMGQFVVALATR